MPMFPDSGVPRGEAINTIDVNTPAGCDELWYSTSRCQPRFDPAAANAMLAEDMNLIMKGEVVYDCSSLTNIERAVRYIDQRGLPRALAMLGGPFAYTGVLDPPATRLNDYMTLTAIPASDNQGAVTLDIGFGPSPLLRNDRLPLKSQDLRAGIPCIIAFYGGYWFHVGMVASQVPIVVNGALDFWIRTDGNDTTGDGTANTPNKAFRTIAGCWNAVGSRFAATPSFSINMKLGIPGDYYGCTIAGFGGVVSLTGDAANPAAYRIHAVYNYPGSWSTLWIAAIANMTITGVSLLIDNASAGCVALVETNNAYVRCSNCRFELLVNNPSGAVYVACGDGSLFGALEGNLYFLGNGLSMSSAFTLSRSCTLLGAYRLESQQSNYYIQNSNHTAPFLLCDGLSVMKWHNITGWSVSGVTGPQYYVDENSIINMGGLICPGTTAGAAAHGGVFIP